MARSASAPAGRRVALLTLATAVAVAARPAGAHPPEVDGQWSAVETWPVSATHAHLLPSGQVLFWSEFMDGDRAYLWDPGTDQVTAAPPPGYNVFCAGHAFLGDGSLLVAGGHADTPWPDTGLPFASTFGPAGWMRLRDMYQGRWYPTVVTLDDGRALVASGWLHEGELDDLPQIWEPATRRWLDLDTARLTEELYPRMLLAPDGRVVEAGPDTLTRVLDVGGTGTWFPLGRTAGSDTRTYGSAVLYGPGKILIMGGGDPPLDTAERIDLGDAVPRWRPAASMAHARRQLNATLLPDGRVLVTGGSAGPGFDDGTSAVLPAEVWDPATDTWTTLAAAADYRGYHATALLLPDGRVLSAGGRLPGTSTPQPTAEVFSPPYLFQGPRPRITAAPAGIVPGDGFHVVTPDATHVSRVTLLRLGSATHAFDMNQRFLELAFTRNGDGLDVKAPATSALAPPGDYMLFLLSSTGVPSLARVVRVAPRAAPGKRVVALSDAWAYDDSGVDRGTAWLAAGYDDSAWKRGPGKLGYGVEAVATALASAAPVPSTYYFRRVVHLDSPATAADLAVLHTDGAAVWVNGVQVYGAGVADASYGAWARLSAPEQLHAVQLAPAPSPFHAGDNVVAAMLKPRGPRADSEVFALDLRVRAAGTPPAPPPTGGSQPPAAHGAGGGGCGANDATAAATIGLLAAGALARTRRRRAAAGVSGGRCV
jgi:galactose oxidase